MPMPEAPGTMFLMPPRKDVCQICATAHAPEMPHNAQSLYYQTAVLMESGLSPNWVDAMQHCTAEMRAKVGQALTSAGVDWENGAIAPVVIKPPTLKRGGRTAPHRESPTDLGER